MKKKYCIYTLLVTIVFSFNSVFAFCDVYNPYTWSEGSVSYGFSITKEETNNYPTWDVKIDPPIKLSKAIMLAINNGKKIKDWVSKRNLESISIIHYPCRNNPEHYIYQFNFEKNLREVSKNQSYVILVLMNGIVKLPVVLNPPAERSIDAKELNIDIEVDGYYVNSKYIGNKYKLIDYLLKIKPRDYKIIYIKTDQKVTGHPEYGLASFLIDRGFPSPLMTKE